MTTISKLDAALLYASWGWRVIPVLPNEKRPASAHGVNDATCDDQQIRKWWGANPDYNIGIAAGEASGIVVFDIDPRNGGDDSWDKFVLEHGNPPDGAYQLTAGGGQHYIAHWQDGIKSCELRAGVDLLANGRYFLASPSSINGKTYEWEASSDPFEGVAPFTIPEAWRAAMSVRKVISNVSEGGLITGNRNAGLTAIAGSMRRYGLTENEIHAALSVANFARCEIPLPSSEVAQIAHSVARYDPESDVAQDMALGAQAVDQMLESKPTHKLAQFVDYDLESVPPTEYIIDGVIAAGLAIIAGSAGAGKTTQIVPLMCRAAHLCLPHDPLKPLIRRKVIYVTEDSRQVLRILRSMREAGEFGGIEKADVFEWFKVVDAARLAPNIIAQVAPLYQELAYDNINQETGVVFKANPVVVFDTLNSTIDLENESDNSEVGRAVAVLKQRFDGIPILGIGHVAKTLKRADVEDFSARGAGAWEADANQVLYLIKEDDGSRWLEVIGAKHRFVSVVDGIKFTASENVIHTHDVMGNMIRERLIHGVPEMVYVGGKAAFKREQEEDLKLGKQAVKMIADTQKENVVFNEVRHLPRSEYRTGNELCAIIGGKKELALSLIDRMIADGKIEKVSIASDPRIIKRERQHAIAIRAVPSYKQESDG
jgi:hypothetical protein